MTHEEACNTLQAAITLASQGVLQRTIEQKAFIRTKNGWVPRPGCLSEYYSSGEAVICGILLSYFIELYGSRYVEIPSSRKGKLVNSRADLIWPGGWYFWRAMECLTDEKCLKAIKMLLF